jgi:N-terminal domain of toast_rack, DUF2154
VKRAKSEVIVLPAAAVLLLFGAGCVVVTEGPSTVGNSAETVDLKGAKSVHMEVEMGAGELKMRGGAGALLNADFRYSPASWKPEVSYEVSGSRGALTVRQPSSHHIGGNHKNEWDLRLNDDVPVDIHVKLGAGTGRLQLGNVALHDLEVEVGAGELNLDLTGHPRNDVDVEVRGGVGQATVRLPRSARLDVEAHGGLGEITTHGLTKQGDRWVNEPAGQAAATMHVNVSGGIGGINLICE